MSSIAEFIKHLPYQHDIRYLSGGLAQLVERVLSMHEVSGSIPEFSMH